ncbi:MAG: hypothetical protein ACM3MD_09730 [Betaproteobacteria bacterium]
MKNSQTVSSYEYKNDFLYIVIREMPERGPQTYLYCCGINTPRFDPLCWGKAGICSNPAFKGLQLLRADVSAFALKKNILPKPAEVNDCVPITHHGHGWYRENLLLTKASSRIIREILEYSVLDLVKTVLVVCAPEAKIPETLPNPPALQKWLESLSVKK